MSPLWWGGKGSCLRMQKWVVIEMFSCFGFDDALSDNRAVCCIMCIINGSCLAQ